MLSLPMIAVFDKNVIVCCRKESEDRISGGQKRHSMLG